jgi:hypothetical protein
MASLSTLPGSTDQVVQQTKDGVVLTFNYYQYLKSLISVIAEKNNQIADLQARTQLIVKTGAPAVGDVPAGQFRVIKNTTGPTYSLVLNDGGVLKSVALT